MPINFQRKSNVKHIGKTKTETNKQKTKTIRPPTNYGQCNGRYSILDKNPNNSATK